LSQCDLCIGLPLPREEGSPAFAEPSEAQAFAMADIFRAGTHWLAVLERLVVAKGLSNTAELNGSQEVLG